MRVLYFTIVSLTAEGNGGSICCRNHVRRLAADPDIELFALAAGPSTWIEDTAAFFDELGVPHLFALIHERLPQHRANKISEIAKFALTMVFQYPWEVVSLDQPAIQHFLNHMIVTHAIDVVVIDFHQSALFLKLPLKNARSVVIGLNREGDFYKDMLDMGLSHHGSLTGPISLMRCRNFEKRINRAVDKVVTIGAPDMPRYPLPNQPQYITPYLDPKANGWRYSATRRAFYVGEINHWPNRLAINWMAKRLAPALLAAGSDIRLTVVGADASELDGEPPPNMDFEGRADPRALSRHFQTTDIMLCPVENDYGVKFKTVEALSYGTPLLASKQTLLGLPHLPDLPAIDLDDPAAAASMLQALLDDADRLKALHAYQIEMQSRFIATQQDVWSRALQPLLARP
jgi:hypothetical protein